MPGVGMTFQELASLALLMGGLGLSASSFGTALRATRGEGPRKLRPLSWAYWSGLALIMVGFSTYMTT